MAFFLSLDVHGTAAVPADLARYNVVWDSPSKDATGSMPLGGGNIGLNVWVEGDDLLFYIGSPDSRVEDSKLVKLGRVRLTFTPSPFRKNFRQELDLAQSCIRISGETGAGRRATIKLWVDAFNPVAHVGLDSRAPMSVSVAYESGRFEAKPAGRGLEWCYRLDPRRNERLAKIKDQNVGAIAEKVPDPLKDLVLGGRIVAAGLVWDGAGEGVYMRTPFKSWKTKTAAPVKKMDLRVLLRVGQDGSEAAWRGEIDRLESATRATGGADFARTAAWWRAFWNRSYVVINPGANPGDNGWQAGRNYQLFRYMLACNRTGRAPTLFNGGFFTFDNPLPDATAYDAAGPSPDERAWWGCMFMGQNQRLVYWPLLKSGDFDALKVGLDFYRDRAALAEAKTKLFFGVEGAVFPESLDLFGLIAACPSGNGLEGAEHLTYHFTSSLEFACMMFEQYRFTGRDFDDSLPVMLGILRFYDQFYQKECRQRTGNPLDDKGRLVIYPGNACEMGVRCKNHTDAVSGLRALTEGLLKFSGGRLSDDHRAWLESFRARIPEIPVATTNGHRVIPLAESWESIANPTEFPQLYCLFPFGNYGVGLPDLALARDTWRYAAFDSKLQKESLCWKYGNIEVARLGLADEAKDYALKKFLYPFGNYENAARTGTCAPFKARFPAFWVTYPFDAFPDMDHGGCAMIGLQEMLLQTPGDRILVLPAWPADWNVRFKLRAPRNTTVECEVREGRITSLEVTPRSRRTDIEIAGPSPLPLSASITH